MNIYEHLKILLKNDLEKCQSLFLRGGWSPAVSGNATLFFSAPV